MSNWYYAVDGGSQGPFDDGALRNLALRGKIGPSTLVWKEGMSAWTAAGELVELQEARRAARVGPLPRPHP